MTHPRLLPDLLAGFLVFLIALPLCLGIALASGFPPIAGVITAVVGGVVGLLPRASALTVKGPAAGLIVLVLGAVTELGAGDTFAGYRATLAVGLVAGLLQVGLALMRAGALASVMPPAVVHGMLAAIGLILVAKQAPVMVGVLGSHGEPWEMLLHLPATLTENNPEILLIGLVALAVLVGAPRVPTLRRVPAPLLVLAATIPLGLALHLSEPHTYTLGGREFSLGPQYLVHLPAGLLESITFPDLSALSNAAAWKWIVAFTLVGSIESLLSVVAVDASDPQRRVSNLDGDLLAVGLGNVVASCLGGLPMISEIVRSRANLDAGATGPRANFFHGMFLLGFVTLLPSLLEQIPLAALAAMLVYTGFRLASPGEFRHAWEIGKDQLLYFVTTLVVTLATDLLLGVAAGLMLKLSLHLLRGVRPSALWRNPLESRLEGGTLLLTATGPLVFTNLLPVQRLLTHLPPEVREVRLDLSAAPLVDHTALEKVVLMAKEWPAARLDLVGLERLKPTGVHPQSCRVGQA